MMAGRRLLNCGPAVHGGWFHGLANQRKNVCCGLGTLAIVNGNYYLSTDIWRQEEISPWKSQSSIVWMACSDHDSAETCGKEANGRFVELLVPGGLETGCAFSGLLALANT